MDLNNIRPRTKEELLKMLKFLSSVKSIEEAKSIFPLPLLQYFEAEQKSTGKSFEEISKVIKEYLTNMKDIKVYIAFKPTLLFLGRISEVLATIMPERFIEVVTEPSMIGGAKVVLDGRIYDNSLLTLLEKKLT
jgi:hypothetical protein